MESRNLKLLVVFSIISCTAAQVTYGFGNRKPIGQRRIFGGQAGSLSEHPYVVGMLTYQKKMTGSGCAIAHFWVLTAAHVISGSLGFVSYDSAYALSGKQVLISQKFRHPDYEVGIENNNVTKLRNDMAMVKTRSAMAFSTSQPHPSIYNFDSSDFGKGVTTLGFGQNDKGGGSRLLKTNLVMRGCNTQDWYYVACGFSPSENSAVCSGDSGGPSFISNALASVTSMGPSHCSAGNDNPTSVVTVLGPYVNLIENTITASSDNAGFRGGSGDGRGGMILYEKSAGVTFKCSSLLLIFLTEIILT